MKNVLSLLSLLLLAHPAAAEWSQLSGQFSGISRPRAEIVRTAADWRRLWSEHMGPDTRLAPPPVDFSREAVVAVFAGERRTAGDDVRVSLRPDAATGGLTVLYAVLPGNPDGFSAEVLSQPFLIRKISRPVGPLTLQRAEPPAPPRSNEARRETLKQVGLRLDALRQALRAGRLFNGAL